MTEMKPGTFRSQLKFLVARSTFAKDELRQISLKDDSIKLQHRHPIIFFEIFYVPWSQMIKRENVNFHIFHMIEHAT